MPFATLEELQEAVYRPGPADDDPRIVDVFERYLPSYSVLWAAGYILGAAGFVCAHRPHLAERVLGRPVAYFFGLGARAADDVLAWADPLLEYRLESAGAKGLLDGPGEGVEGLDWLGATGFGAEAVVADLFHGVVVASGRDGEGLDWLRANLSEHRAFIGEVLGRLTREQEERDRSR